MPRKSARRPRPDACRIFHPNADELIRALTVAFGLPPPRPALRLTPKRIAPRARGGPPMPRNGTGQPSAITRRVSPNDTTSGTHCSQSIARAQRLVDSAAILASDVATLAARTGRGDHARAATHLTQAAHHAWRAAEALCEGAA
jgi:hypothetical protein